MSPTLEPITGKSTVTLEPMTVKATGTVEWSTESWQFFAFMFAAVVTLVLELLGEIPHVGWRLGLKVGAFIVIGYATLFDQRCKSRLTRVLRRIKK